MFQQDAGKSRAIPARLAISAVRIGGSITILRSGAASLKPSADIPDVTPFAAGRVRMCAGRVRSPQ
jgi:hypothetical protein